VKDLLVYICNKFDELGFSFISLYAHPNAKAELAMSINRKYDCDYIENYWRIKSIFAMRPKTLMETKMKRASV
jgi:hypothetical protein